MCEGGRGRWDLEEGISKYLGVLRPVNHCGYIWGWGGGGGAIFNMRQAEEGEGKHKGQHRKMTLEKKILPQLLPGLNTRPFHHKSIALSLSHPHPLYMYIISYILVTLY